VYALDVEEHFQQIFLFLAKFFGADVDIYLYLPVFALGNAFDICCLESDFILEALPAFLKLRQCRTTRDLTCLRQRPSR
jgi:hypothetical protein